jgi:hypothetical protein
MSPPDYTGVLKVLYDWQTVITGLLAIVSASIAYKATRQAADRQIAAIKASDVALSLPSSVGRRMASSTPSISPLPRQLAADRADLRRTTRHPAQIDGQL